MYKSNNRRQNQGGQALVWFLSVIAASVVVLYGVYNMAQITSSKQKLVNATDASALAGAAEQARLLNFISYGNRAMIATDVMVAQMVSLDSWLRWLRQSSLNISYYSRAIPYLQVISSVFSGAYQLADSTERALSNVLSNLFLGFDLFKDQVRFVNNIVYQSGGILASSAAESVLQANTTTLGGRTDTPPHNASMAIDRTVRVVNEASWRDFTQVYSGQRRERAAQVVNDSRDAFSVRRDGNALTRWNLGLVRSQKLGITLLRDFDRWEAQDTWDIRIRRPFRSALVLPIGWGRADAGEGGHLMIGNEAVHDAAFLSRIDYSWSGISSVRDLSAPDVNNQLLFIRVASRPQHSDMTTSAIGMGSSNAASAIGSAHLDESLLEQQLTAISAARVYFERPQRGINDWTADAWAGNPTLMRQDSEKEYASLYNPYWQVSLAPVPASQKSALLVALGAPGLAAVNMLPSLN